VSQISLLAAAIADLKPCEIYYLSGDVHDCPEPATFHHLETELEVCNRHIGMLEKEFEQ
jgi:hypothetical protein